MKLQYDALKEVAIQQNHRLVLFLQSLAFVYACLTIFIAADSSRFLQKKKKININNPSRAASRLIPVALIF
jgi:hypothetical protein